MIPIPELPIYIRGAVGPKVLSKAPELFSQNISTIFAELMQNCRRAGATSIDIKTATAGKRTFMTITDNGHGIANMQKLVTFGDSGWDPTTDVRENAAGMGLFSLASRGATIDSNGQHTHLTSAVFTGQEEAAVSSCDHPRGTTITFELSTDECASYLNILERTALFHPIQIAHNGTKLESAEFLNNAFTTKKVDGVTIGIYNVEAKANRARETSKINHPSNSRSEADRTSYVNFFGHVVQLSLDHSVHVYDAGSNKLWTVLYDVSNAPDIRLILPTRNGIIENEAFAKLLANAKRLIFETIARQPNHRIAMKDVHEARALGIKMPDPQIVLDPWQTPRDEESGFLAKKDVLNTAEKNIVIDFQSDEFDTAIAMMQSHLDVRFWHANRNYETLEAYETLPRIRSIEAIVQTKDKQNIAIDLLDVFEGRQLLAAALDTTRHYIQQRVEQISVTINAHGNLEHKHTATQPEKLTLRANLPFLLLSAENDYPGDYEFVISEPNITKLGEISDQVTASIWTYDRFNGEDQKYEASEHDNDLHTTLRALYRTTSEHTIDQAMEFINEKRFYLSLTSNGISSITINSIPCDKQGGWPKLKIKIVHTDGTSITTNN